MPVIQYQAACKALKAAGQRKALAENRLRQLLGNGRRFDYCVQDDRLTYHEVGDALEDGTYTLQRN
jgi:hypothetical protein